MYYFVDFKIFIILFVSILYRIKFIPQFLGTFKLFVHFAGFTFEYSLDNYLVT